MTRAFVRLAKTPKRNRRQTLFYLYIFSLAPLTLYNKQQTSRSISRMSMQDTCGYCSDCDCSTRSWNHSSDVDCEPVGSTSYHPVAHCRMLVGNSSRADISKEQDRWPCRVERKQCVYWSWSWSYHAARWTVDWNHLIAMFASETVSCVYQVKDLGCVRAQTQRRQQQLLPFAVDVSRDFRQMHVLRRSLCHRSHVDEIPRRDRLSEEWWTEQSQNNAKVSSSDSWSPRNRLTRRSFESVDATFLSWLNASNLYHHETEDTDD